MLLFTTYTAAILIPNLSLAVLFVHAESLMTLCNKIMYGKGTIMCLLFDVTGWEYGRVITNLVIS